MSSRKLTRMQVAVVLTLRDAAKKLDRGGFVPWAVVSEICHRVFGVRVNTLRTLKAIEDFDPKILRRDPRTSTCISRRAPKPSEINTNTPKSDVITDEALNMIIGKH